MSTPTHSDGLLVSLGVASSKAPTFLFSCLQRTLYRHCGYHYFSHNFSTLQLLCEEWNGKSDTDKTFKPFYSAVNNIVQAGASSGETFRRTSVVLSQVTVMQKIGIGKKFNCLYLREIG